MPAIKAFLCPKCNKPWQSEEEAEVCELSCLRKDRAQKAAATKRKNAKKKLEDFRNYIRLNLESINDAPKMIEKHYKSIGINMKITEFSVRYLDIVSNSHNAPLSGVTNWCREDDDRPLGYPGFTGQISFKENKIDYELLKKTFPNLRDVERKDATDIFDEHDQINSIGFNNGCGGGGGDGKYSYNIKLFIDDFPIIKKKYEEWLILQEKADAYADEAQKRLDEHRERTNLFVQSDSICIEIDKELDEFRKKVAQVEQKYKKRKEKLEKEYKDSHYKSDVLDYLRDFEYDEKKHKELLDSLGIM